MQIFAATYPGQVAGMVLLDSQPPNAFTSLPGYPGFYSSFRKATALFPSLARFGVLRLVYSSAVSGLPPQARAEERAFWSTASHYRSLRDEFLELPTALTQAQALKSLGGKPSDSRHRREGRSNRMAPPARQDGHTVNEQRPPRHAERDTHIAHRGQD